MPQKQKQPQKPKRHKYVFRVVATSSTVWGKKLSRDCLQDVIDKSPRLVNNALQNIRVQTVDID